MIRIMTATEPDASTITVDGQVAAEYVEAIDICVKQAIGRGQPVHLFLRDVSGIDATGRALLGRLAAKVFISAPMEFTALTSLRKSADPLRWSTAALVATMLFAPARTFGTSFGRRRVPAEEGEQNPSLPVETRMHWHIRGRGYANVDSLVPRDIGWILLRFVDCSTKRPGRAEAAPKRRS